MAKSTGQVSKIKTNTFWSASDPRSGSEAKKWAYY
jgi:hypothetical protein